MIKDIVLYINNNSGALSVVFSVIAVIVAIIVPAVIASNQKKIALYNERLKVYEALEFIIRFCNSIKAAKVYDSYRDDKERLKQYSFKAWVICLRTQYSDAWRIKFDSVPKNKVSDLQDEEKEMEMICYSHLKGQYDDLRKSKYVFNGEIEKKIRELAILYFELVNELILNTFHGEFNEDPGKLPKLLKLTDDFTGDTKDKIVKKLKL